MAGSVGGFSEGPSIKELETIVKCIVCHEIPLAPIYQCNTGHNICSTCRPRLKTCALCKDNISGTRNFALEEIVEASSFKCDWEEEGCQQITPGSQLKGHLEQCRFRPVKCQLGLFNGCNNSLVKVTEYLKHMKEKHGGLIISSSTQIENFSVSYESYEMKSGGEKTEKFYWPCAEVKWDDHQFVSFTFQQNSITYYSFAILGEDADAQNYSVILSFRKSDVDPIIGKATLPVISFRKSWEDMMTNDRFITLVFWLQYLSLITRRKEVEKIGWTVDYEIRKRRSGESTTNNKRRLYSSTDSSGESSTNKKRRLSSSSDSSE